MLIDSTHRRWILITLVLGVVALGLYEWARRTTPGGLTGGSVVGLWYGIAGTSLMTYAGLLAGLRKVPSWWWIGARKVWLRGHIWLGLLSLPLILCHAGYRLGGPLEMLLLLVLVLTLATGVFGLILQQFLPHLIAARIQAEAPYEQIPHLCQVLVKKADFELANLMAAGIEASQASIMVSQLGTGAKFQFQDFYEQKVRPFLVGPYDRSAPLADPLRSETAFARFRALPGLTAARSFLDKIEVLCSERRQFGEQERLHHWLHGWLYIHIPLSVLLLVLTVAHVVTALYY